ncbi:MAG: hypothetical protein AB8B53_06445 [Flavobacteriales bacterium]
MKLLAYTSLLHFLSLIFIGACASNNASSADLNPENAIAVQQIEENIKNPPHYEVSISYPQLMLSDADLFNANTLSDLDSTYKDSWVESYISVEISALVKGVLATAKGTSHELNSEQKALIKSSDTDSPINAKISYMPENSLSQNDPKETNFKLYRKPFKNATYPGGNNALLDHVKKHVINYIPEGSYTGYALSALTFTVTKKGEVAAIEVVDPYMQDEKILELMVSSIEKMPRWSPAQYADGSAAPQNFALIIGNMENCTLNLLNLE